ncbi:TPA: hypothetical protein LK594_003061 [Enterococcus faecium]|uniref:TnpA C-terminal n=1 Tax=Enterococcus faecium TaxID=1352 RepID=Q6V4T2_ENTFC|nr:TnpA C-terminal fragment [Enterococcus faecium]EKZ0055510.1 hypothetical protein [Enterococcus faecalis]EKZ0493174.1 hypothetical protein [Enterococcus faecalis]EKZ0493958.1 hypothetical protein [Enterococcus faecalis]QMX45264.1 hypothetical protein HI839_015070 [Enterococcus faecium]
MVCSNAGSSALKASKRVPFLRAKIIFNEKLHKKRKPRFNSSAFSKAMLYDSFNSYQITDRDKTGNYGVDFSTLIKKLEKSNL